MSTLQQESSIELIITDFVAQLARLTGAKVTLYMEWIGGRKYAMETDAREVLNAEHHS